MKRPNAQEVEAEIASLDQLDITSLQNRWRELYGIEPPFKVRAGFLRYAIAYRLQEHLYGGLSPATKRLLRRVAEEARRNRPIGKNTRRERENVNERVSKLASVRVSLQPGTKLVREWAGRNEVVTVVRDGLEWRGRIYKTLSAAAVAITGTKWSGPKFFGLLPQKVRTLPIDRAGDAR